MSKPAEFWITMREDGEPTHIALFKQADDRPQLHVIEYSAYAETICDIQTLTQAVIDSMNATQAERQRNEKLVELLNRAEHSLQMHRDKGHNDTCSHALSEELKCDCGVAMARNIVRDIQALKENKEQDGKG